VCLIIRSVTLYARPVRDSRAFLAGNIQGRRFRAMWRDSELFASLRQPQSGGACRSCSAFDSCQGGCMAAKFFTGLPLDGPDPECVRGFGESALAVVDAAAAPRSSADHSRGRRPVSVSIGPRPGTGLAGSFGPPAHACDPNPLAGFRPTAT
jgi:radical SAM protein with 4Fe4S-binding SPASM domain